MRPFVRVRAVRPHIRLLVALAATVPMLGSGPILAPVSIPGSGPILGSVSVPVLRGGSGLQAQAIPEQLPPVEVQRHIAAARAAAGDEHVRSFHYLCQVPDAPRGGAAAPAPAGRPDWYAEPAQVFDNLFFLGTRSLNAWAVTTSEGIVIIDPLYDYNVDEAILEGLEKLGLDPTEISHVLVSHGHGDHYGGARQLQEAYGARVIMGTADWDMMLASGGSQPRPERDIEVSEDQILLIGDTPFTLTLTPGHTPGTISTLLPVWDGDRTHVAALWGGTAMRASRDFYDEYEASALAFADVVREAGADVLISNHDIFDEAHRKIAALSERAPGDPHPFVLGEEVSANYLEVVQHCAAAGRARLGTATE